MLVHYVVGIHFYPAITRRWTNAGLMLALRLRRCSSIKPLLAWRLMFAGIHTSIQSIRWIKTTYFVKQTSVVQIARPYFDAERRARPHFDAERALILRLSVSLFWRRERHYFDARAPLFCRRQRHYFDAESAIFWRREQPYFDAESALILQNCTTSHSIIFTENIPRGVFLRRGD